MINVLTAGGKFNFKYLIATNEPMIKEVLKAIAEMFKLPIMFVAFKIYFNHKLSVWFFKNIFSFQRGLLNYKLNN
jgi:hypothetical protein